MKVKSKTFLLNYSTPILSETQMTEIRTNYTEIKKRTQNEKLNKNGEQLNK